MREGLEGLLEGGHRLAERGAVLGPGASLLAVGHGLVPHLAPQGMVRQAFDLLGHPVGGERLDGLDQARVQPPPPLQQQAAVGHLVGQGMLEGVFRLREQARLIQKLRRLQVRQAAVQRPSGTSAMARSSAKGTSVPSTAAVCNSPFSSGAKRSMRAASTAWTVAGTWDVLERRGQPIGPWGAHQDRGLDQRAYTLFQKERIAGRARHEQRWERCQAGVVPE